jgi:hypothetical protein
MIRSLLLLSLCLLLSCGERQSQRQSASEIRAVYEMWRADPSSQNLSLLRARVEESIVVDAPGDELAIALGAALSNAMLRPDIGVPLLASATRDDWAEEEYRDALARRNPYALKDHLKDLEFDPGHSTAQTLSLHAASDPFADWRTLVQGTQAAQMLDDVRTTQQFIVNESVQDIRTLLQMFGVLLPTYEFTAVTARSTTRADKDPLLTTGVIEAHGGRRRVIGSLLRAKPEALADLGGGVDKVHSPNTITLVLRAYPPLGAGLLFSIEGEFVDDGFRIFAASDRGRTVVVAQAANAYSSLVSEGVLKSTALEMVYADFATTMITPMEEY